MPSSGGGGVALLGLAGEASAQQTTCPLDAAGQAAFKPYICGVSRPAGGTTQKVTWRVTFSEPVSGVDWRDFMTEDTYNLVPGYTDRRYGLGTVWEEIKKVSGTAYDISMRWDCTASDNDCSHNEDLTPTYRSGVRNDRYVGEVWLELQEGAAFNEMHSPASPIPVNTHVGIPTPKVSVN